MTKSNEDQRQPRALTEDALIQESGLYRAGMYAELQKFHNPKKARQLVLSEGFNEQQAEEWVEQSGLNLSVTEDRALAAIQILLHRTNYQGNEQGEVEHSEAFHWEGTRPRLLTTYSEYLEAYGIQPKHAHYYKSHQADEAIKALESLAKPRRIIYERKHWKGKGKQRKLLSDIIVTQRPLIFIDKGYKDLEQSEADQVKAGQDLPERTTRILIECSPLLVDSIDTFYLLKPEKLYQQIQAHLGSRRISKAVPLFIQWLLTKNFSTVKITREHLAEKLYLDNLIKQRKQSLLDKRLHEAIQTALELRFLLDYEVDTFGVFIFTLNPKRCSRFKQPPELGQGEQQEEDL